MDVVTACTRAARAGAAAYGYPGSLRLPGKDAVVLSLLTDATTIETRTVMAAYEAGWDAADVATTTTGEVPPLTERVLIGQDAADRFLSPPCQEVSMARPRTLPTVVEHWDGPVLTGHVEAVASCSACIANGLTGCATPRPAATPGPGANRPCADCGTNVTHEATGTWRAPFYSPCPTTGATDHRPTL